MRIESVEITGMHKIDKKVYHFNDDISYLIGPNGAGKSTVLEAVQLALLGYIPGLKKTNEEIMRHANGPILAVRVKLRDKNTVVSISRTWNRNKRSVVSSLNVDPEGYDIKSIIDELELPIFNFSDFMSLSANKLKDWFIRFLPNSCDSVNWKKELITALSDAGITMHSETVLENIMQFIQSCTLQGVELVAAVNTYLKEQLSLNKALLDQLQGTINTLVFDDSMEITDSIEEINIKLSYLHDRLIQLNNQKYKQEQQKSIVSRIEGLKQYIITSFGPDADSKEWKDALEEKQAAYNELQTKLAGINNKITELTFSISSKNSILRGDGICPYNKQKCESITAYLDKVKSEIESLEAEKQTVSNQQFEVSTIISLLAKEIEELRSKVNAFDKNMSQLQLLTEELDTSISIDDNLDDIIDSTQSEYNEASNMLSVAKANERYNQLIDSTTAKKFEYEQNIEIIKCWIKLTDANGLQTSIMDGQFKDFENELTPYIQKMYNNEDVSAKFNLIAKANSFSFGLVSNGDYIPYDLLSSGEKCIYMFAIMSCIIMHLDNPLKVILVDDALDHLDAENLDAVFKNLPSKNIQYIIAGVNLAKNADKYKINI